MECVFAAAMFFGLIMALVGLRLSRSELRFGAKTYPHLADLVYDIEWLTRLRVRQAPGRLTLTGLGFAGKVGEGREATLEFLRETPRSSTVLVQLSVVADDTPHLRVTPESVVTTVKKALGSLDEIEVGDVEFDGRFLLETSHPERARKVLRGDLQKAIARAFNLGVRDLLIANGRIIVTAPASELDPELYPSLLATLDRAARTLDRKSVSVRVLGGERRGLVGTSGKTRCPFCRSDFTGDEEGLVACDQCATVLHGACWDELGGCPLFGCTGTHPERASRSRSA